MVGQSDRNSHERDIIRTARALLADRRPHDALQILRVAVRERLLSAEGMERAGATILAAFAGLDGPRLSRALVLGQVATSWLKHCIAAEALGAGLDLVVDDGSFDNVLQDVSALPDVHGPDAPTLILLPWNARLLADDARTTDERVQDEVGYWQNVWTSAQSKGITRFVQVGFDWTGPGASGYHLTNTPGGSVHTVGAANEALRRALPLGAFFVPLDQLSGMEGRRVFYDSRRYFWTRQPFSERGLVALAEHIVAGVRVMTVGPKKVVVVDLDNTLWGGVVGEVGAQGVALGGTPDGDAYLAFQRHLCALDARGVLLAACSKNNREDAREPFTTRSESVLSLDDFAAFEASWDSKVEGLRRIAATLNVGLDSFVFFDDNPAEREQVRQSLPEVVVVDVPEDPADFVRALEGTLAFETLSLTAEDLQRRELYATDRRRLAGASEGTSVEDYLRSLEMVGVIRPIDAADLPRVAQLLGKTNQFNLTTRRHNATQIRELLSRRDAVGFSLRLRDRFGDHGLVAVLIATPGDDEAAEQRTLVVDTLLMSCRVIGRTAEHLIVQRLIDEAQARGFAVVRGEFVPTAKNALVRGFWESMGFTPAAVTEPAADGTAAFELRVDTAPAIGSFVAHDRSDMSDGT